MSLRALVILGVLLLLVDITSKSWIQSNLPLMSESRAVYPYGGIAIFSDFFGVEFSITHHTNMGAAWGSFRQHSGLLLVVRVLLIAVLLSYMLLRFRQLGASSRWGLTLIITGAIGNVLDHLWYGHVIDMLHFVFWGYDYPVFNLADSYIFVGVACLLIWGRTDACTQRNES